MSNLSSSCPHSRRLCSRATSISVHRRTRTGRIPHPPAGRRVHGGCVEQSELLVVVEAVLNPTTASRSLVYATSSTRAPSRQRRPRREECWPSCPCRRRQLPLRRHKRTTILERSRTHKARRGSGERDRGHEDNPNPERCPGNEVALYTITLQRPRPGGKRRADPVTAVATNWRTGRRGSCRSRPYRHAKPCTGKARARL
jgi:hypothetical protein